MNHIELDLLWENILTLPLPSELKVAKASSDSVKTLCFIYNSDYSQIVNVWLSHTAV